MRIGVDYYPEQWDRSLWESDADLMQQTGVEVVRLAEFAWCRLEPQDGSFDFGWLDDIIGILTERGIRIVLCTPTNCPPLWFYEKYPEAVQTEKDGHKTRTGIRGHRCINNTNFLRYAERIIDVMAKRYADNESVIAWQIDNELEANFCFCETCIGKYRNWLKNKYTTLEAVNTAYGNAMWSGEYSSWEQIQPPFGSYAPYGECAFYSKDTSFSLANAVTDIDLSKVDDAELENLYANSKISIEAYKIIKDIDNISALMQRMEDANVTVMWRPLHEASGGWFWWGASGADAYKWLWKLMYHRMTDYHELDNLIWVWNAQSADWYPGDEYCDISATDIYNRAYDYGTSPGLLAEMTGWSDGKLVTMSECATMPDPDLIVRDNAYWLWFAVWNWDFIVKNGTTELSDAYTSFDMMKKVYNSDVIITRDELPDFNS